jgi:hypothetical protein
LQPQQLTRETTDMGQADQDLQWRVSSFSDGMQCVELAQLPDGGTTVRDSKDPDGPVLNFSRGEMLAFLQGAKAGEFDDFA